MPFSSNHNQVCLVFKLQPMDFWLDLPGRIGFNNSRMKKIAYVIAGAVAAVLLASCGECACNSYNSDYLRDVPVYSNRAFYE